MKPISALVNGLDAIDSLLGHPALGDETAVDLMLQALAAPQMDRLDREWMAERLGREPRVANTGRVLQVLEAIEPHLDRSWGPEHLGSNAWELLRFCVRTVPSADLPRIQQWAARVRGDWHRVAVHAARRASALVAANDAHNHAAIRHLTELAEQFVFTAKDLGWRLAAAMDVLEALRPLTSRRSLELLLMHREDRSLHELLDPYRGTPVWQRFWGYVASTRLPDDQLQSVLECSDSNLDEALSFSPSITFSLAAELNRRYGSLPPEIARRYVAVLPGVAERLLSADDHSALRGLARKLDRIEPEHRRRVARAAFRAIRAFPRDDDADAVYWIVRELGEEAAVPIVELRRDLLARSVRRAWRWTADRTFEALASYPREIVRRALVPGGAQWGQPYTFTAEQERALRHVILPRLLNDRAGEVRDRAERLRDFFEWRDRTGQPETAYPYPPRFASAEERQAILRRPASHAEPEAERYPLGELNLDLLTTLEREEPTVATQIVSPAGAGAARQDAPMPSAPAPTKRESSPRTFEAGARVRSQRWGDGVILSRSTSAQGVKLEIDFGGELRKLQVPPAALERIDA